MIDWFSFTWAAFATLTTGVAAIASATWVAFNQISLKRQELRLTLLDRRIECIAIMLRLVTLLGSHEPINKEDGEAFLRAFSLTRLIFEEPVINQTSWFFKQFAILRWLSIPLEPDSEIAQDVQERLQKIIEEMWLQARIGKI